MGDEISLMGVAGWLAGAADLAPRDLCRAELIVQQAFGNHGLSGRFFAAPGVPSAIVEHAEEIRSKELHVLRMQFREPS